MRTMFVALMGLIVVASTGCAGRTYLGADDTGAKYYAFYTSHVFSPGATVITKTETVDGTRVSKAIGFVGDKSTLNTIGPAGAVAIGDVAAANTFGSNLQPDRTSVQSSSEGNKGGASASGSATATGTGGNGGSSAASVDQSKHDNSLRIDESRTTTTDNRQINQSVNVGK